LTDETYLKGDQAKNFACRNMMGTQMKKDIFLWQEQFVILLKEMVIILNDILIYTHAVKSWT
jgi:hypothetical protein